ncbi:msl6120 [Mesorhizobium japonicum MAFF 303099]|uniref:Msl6120 protein n=1 Tax=Mesorhizobium japonicum (strain LMG 29417 / CECT 9101 / MAFF 303099) TaxID=266835 RepID=Q98A75_RHILO|nr:msl6120 [Mesorhizobium japonicum MAFF 303099]
MKPVHTALFDAARASLKLVVEIYTCTFPLPDLQAAIHCIAEVESSKMATRFAKPKKALRAVLTGLRPSYAS